MTRDSEHLASEIARQWEKDIEESVERGMRTMRKNIIQIMLGVLAGFEGSLGVELLRVLDLSGQTQIIIFIVLIAIFFVVLYSVLAMHSSKKVKEQVISEARESMERARKRYEGEE